MTTTDFSCSRITHPAVLTALCCIICLYILLCAKLAFALSLILCALCIFICFTIIFINDGIKTAIILAVCVLLCVFHGMFSYFTVESRAISFINAHQESDSLYEVKITSCKNYPSLVTADGIILSCNGEKLKDKFTCRITSHSAENLSGGCTVFFKGTPHFPSNDNADGFDNISYLRSRKCFITFSQVSVLSSCRNKMALSEKIHKYIEGVLYKYISSKQDTKCCGLAYSMLLGDSRFLDGSLKDSFTKSGIIHLLCVSGMHLSVIMGAVSGMLKTFCRNRHISFAIFSLVCIIYLAVIGFPLSAVRAGILCIISYGGILLGRSTEGFTSLFASAIILCLISPYSVLDISAQLSFLSSLGIISCHHLLLSGKRTKPTLCAKLIRYIVFLTAVSLAASFFTCLISAHNFKGMSVTSVPATVLCSFASELLLILLLILILLSPLTLFESSLFFIGYICKKCAEIIIFAGNLFSGLKYSYASSSDTLIPLIVFLGFAVLLSAFTYFSAKKLMLTCYICCITVCLFSYSNALCQTIADDHRYKISYFRQNEKDRQLSVKLASEGYLIINADSALSLNKDEAAFDYKKGNNYILIIPNELTDADALCKNLSVFNEQYGIKMLLLPPTDDGNKLMDELLCLGCNAKFINNSVKAGKTSLKFDFKDNAFLLTVNDGKTKSQVLFCDTYSSDYFDTDSDICAFFTRNNSNQFKPEIHPLPNCRIFVTRMGKNEKHEKIYNTFGEKSFYIKE